MKLYKAFYRDDNENDKVIEFEAIDNDGARKVFNEKVECEEINVFYTKIFVIGEQISY